MRAVPLLVAGCMVCLATQAFATGTHYPPGPGGTCPDTLTIMQIENGPCRPPAVGSNVANTDTSYVYGIKGIVTGIKNNGTSRTFYMQARRSDLSYTGMDCFNGNGLYNPTIQIGDSVSVTGKVEEGFVKAGFPESGETEITSLPNTVTPNGLPTMILSSGNALPNFHETSIAEIRFPSVEWDGTVNASYATGEPWENTLVKINGPLIVGLRAYNGAVLDTAGANETYASYPGIELRSPGGGGFLCFKEGFPGDSIYVDMTSFVTMTPPPVGTKIDSLFGVLQSGGTRSGAAGRVYYRIALRSSAPTYSNASTADIFLATPPGVAAAFSVADDSVKIIFDRAVTEASATITSHYSLLTSERPVDYVRMSGNNAVVIHADGAYADGEPEIVSANNMVGLVNGLEQTSAQQKSFINGVLPITMIQAPDPAYLGVCEDRSKFAGPGITDGPRLTFTGVVTGRYFTREYYVQDEAGGARSGVKVFQPGAVLTVGRKYLISGVVTEFAGETEVNAPPYIEDLGPATTPPIFTSSIAVLDDFTCDATPGAYRLSAVTNGEDYEGCLVTFNHHLVTKSDAIIAGPGGFFHCYNAAALPDTTTDIEIEATEATGYDPQPNQYLDVTGVLSYRFGQGIVFPRNDADLVLVGDVGVDPDVPAKVSFAAYPNPARVTQFNFAVPRKELVELSVYDLLGRKVATVARGVFEPGTYKRAWDGRTDSGTGTRSGVFFYRLKVGSEVFNIRGVRIN